jgi:hypothetical protein
MLINFAGTHNSGFVLSRHKIRHNRDRYCLGTMGAFFPQPTRFLCKVISNQEHEVLVGNIFTFLISQSHNGTVIILCEGYLSIVVERLDSGKFGLAFDK